MDYFSSWRRIHFYYLLQYIQYIIRRNNIKIILILSILYSIWINFPRILHVEPGQKCWWETFWFLELTHTTHLPKTEYRNILYIYIYIYREREREREWGEGGREGERESGGKEGERESGGKEGEREWGEGGREREKQRWSLFFLIVTNWLYHNDHPVEL